MNRSCALILLVVFTVAALVGSWFLLMPHGYARGWEGAFETLPPDDSALETWLRSQPTVKTVRIRRNRNAPGYAIRINYTGARNALDRVASPDIEAQCAKLGYQGRLPLKLDWPGNWQVDRWGEPKNGGVPGIDFGSFHAWQWGDDARLLIWTDLAQTAPGGGSGTDTNTGRLVATFRRTLRAPQGHQVRMEFSTPDDDSIDPFVIDGKTFNVADGALVLVSVASGTTHVKQLRHGLMPIGQVEKTIRELAARDAEIQAFFRKAHKPWAP